MRRRLVEAPREAWPGNPDPLGTTSALASSGSAVPSGRLPCRRLVTAREGGSRRRHRTPLILSMSGCSGPRISSSRSCAPRAATWSPAPTDRSWSPTPTRPHSSSSCRRSTSASTPGWRRRRPPAWPLTAPRPRAGWSSPSPWAPGSPSPWRGSSPSSRRCRCASPGTPRRPTRPAGSTSAGPMRSWSAVGAPPRPGRRRRQRGRPRRPRLRGRSRPPRSAGPPSATPPRASCSARRRAGWSARSTVRSPWSRCSLATTRGRSVGRSVGRAGGGLGRAGGHTGIVLRPGRIGPIIRPKRGPRPPTDLETSIEAPYRLQVSPSRFGAFTHDPAPTRSPVDPTRTELGRHHLTVRTEDRDGTFTGLDDTDETQRIVRAVWSRDLDPADAAALDDPAPLTPQSLRPTERRAIVRQTSDVRLPKPPRPLDVHALSLSSLGAFLDWRGGWLTAEVTSPTNPAPPGTDIVDYRHQAFMGRDGYVRVAYPGILFPFGHRCFLVKITEREIKHRDTPVAYLWQRWFIIVRQPTRTYPPADLDNPFGQVTVSPLVRRTSTRPRTEHSRSCRRATASAFPFTLTAGRPRRADPHAGPAPLVFVQAGQDGRPDVRRSTRPRRRRGTSRCARSRAAGRRSRSRAPVKAGDTSVEVTHLIFDGEIDSRQRHLAAVPAPRRAPSCRRCGTSRRRRRPSTSSSPSPTSRTGCRPGRPTPRRCRGRRTPAS